MKLKILTILIIIISLNCKIINENKGSYNITVNENEKYKEIKTSNDGIVYENINNYLLKVYPDSFLTLKNNEINLIYGKIFYIKHNGNNNFKSYYKNQLLNFDIDNKIILDNEQGKVSFYRFKLPDNIDVESEIDIIYYVNENKKTVEKKVKKN